MADGGAHVVRRPTSAGDESGRRAPTAAWAAADTRTRTNSAIFTTKRLIVLDAQGLTGKKVEIYSLPYSSINMWSSENAGTLDWNSEIELWTRAGHIKIKLAKGADVRRIDSLIARAALFKH